MRLLNGAELAEFIKQRQAHEVRQLRQAHGVSPKLAIILTVEHAAINAYIRMKTKYGADILIDVDTYKLDQSEVAATIEKLNKDETVHGIIVQLPLNDPSQTDEIVDLVAPQKDVDALGKNAIFDPATPMAILWLLAGYNITLDKGKKVLLIGRGKLVGAPLQRILLSSGVDVTVAHRSTTDLTAETLAADVIISATGNPGLLKPDMIKRGAVVVDAGTASEGGKTVGDLAPEVYERDDLTLTPAKGGVGPLTICALFDNVIRAARQTTQITQI